MKYFVLVLLIVNTCFCIVDFNERPRNFSLELLYHTQKELDGHVQIAPFGLWTLMVGLALGATDNSSLQLDRAINFPRDHTILIEGYNNLTSAVLQSTNQVSLKSRNFVLLEKKTAVFLAFRNSMQYDYGATVKVTDDIDNDRIVKAEIDGSGGRVKTELSLNDTDGARLMFANVFAFKAPWKYPFEKRDTTVESFYDENEQVIGRVNMMVQKGYFAFSDIEAFKSFALELPFGTDGKYSMLIILPHRKRNISDIYLNFVQVSLTNIFEKLQNDVKKSGMKKVVVKLPRFYISSNLLLNKPLLNMGLYDIFQQDIARFDNIAKEMSASVVSHKSDLEVSELGIVTSTGINASTRNRVTPSDFQVNCNKPFLYFIVEKTTTTIIFSGIYRKPTRY